MRKAKTKGQIEREIARALKKTDKKATRWEVRKPLFVEHIYNRAGGISKRIIIRQHGIGGPFVVTKAVGERETPVGQFATRQRARERARALGYTDVVR